MKLNSLNTLNSAFRSNIQVKSTGVLNSDEDTKAKPAKSASNKLASAITVNNTHPPQPGAGNGVQMLTGQPARKQFSFFEQLVCEMINLFRSNPQNKPR